MNKLNISLFILIFGCVKNNFEVRDKVFSLDEFKTLVKQEDITEYLLKNEYDLKQKLEKKEETLLHVLLEKKMEAEAIKLLDKLKELEQEERDAFLKRKNEQGDEALYLAIDNGYLEILQKIFELHSKKARNERLCFEYYRETILDRAIKNKNAKVMINLIKLKKEYKHKAIEKNESNKVRTESVITDILSNVLKSIKIQKVGLMEEKILLNEEEQKESLVLELIKESILKKECSEIDRNIKTNFNKLIRENKKEILILASYIGDKRVIERYLNKKEVNIKDKEERTLLILASASGQKEVAELLLKKGATIDLAMNNGRTPLQIASTNGHKKVVELLLSKGASINLGNIYGSTPLYIASCNGHKEVAELLLTNGAGIDLSDKEGWTPLYIASTNRHKEVVELLLNKGAKVDITDKDGWTPLYVASYNGYKEIVEMLLSKGASIDLGTNNGATPLYAASQEGLKEIVELLIEKGAKVDLANEYGQTPLWAASCYGNKEVVELLLSKGATIDLGNKEEERSLWIASQEGQEEVVELLLTKGAGIDLVDKYGATSLWAASRYGHKEVVELLLSKGAFIDLGNDNVATPLFVASQNGHKEVVELLLKKGAAIDLARKDGKTPLWMASKKGHKEVVKLLISKGADINKVNLKGESILEAALLNKKEEVIEELLSSFFVKGEGIVLSSSSLIVNEGALNLFNKETRWNSISLTLSFAKIYRVLNEIYSKQFIREVERDFDKSCTIKLVEIMDEVTSLNELNTELRQEEVKITNIKNDDSKDSKRTKYEICEMIDNLNKMFNKSRDLKANAVYDKFKNNREVILNRRVKAGYYKDYTILMLEVLKGDLDKVLDRVKELIKQGSDVNAAGQNGNSCLALAIKKNLKGVVEELISNGAAINAVNKNGENGLMIAVEGNLVDMVKRLAPLINIDHKDIFKNTALMLAIKKIMHINPNFSDSEKRFNDIEEIIDILIKSGAKVTKDVMDLLEEKKEDEKLKNLYFRLRRILDLKAT